MIGTVLIVIANVVIIFVVVTGLSLKAQEAKRLKKAHAAQVKSKTGVFTTGKNGMIPKNEYPENEHPRGSVASWEASFGYKDGLHHVYFADSEKLWRVVTRYCSKEPIFVELRDETMSISYDELVGELAKVDWGMEFAVGQFEFDQKVAAITEKMKAVRTEIEELKIKE